MSLLQVGTYTAHVNGDSATLSLDIDLSKQIKADVHAPKDGVIAEVVSCVGSVSYNPTSTSIVGDHVINVVWASGEEPTSTMGIDTLTIVVGFKQ